MFRFALLTSFIGTVSLATAAAPPACALAAAPAERFAVRVPFEVVDGRIYVQASVNGRGPFRFAVDTGAGGVARADTALVKALDLKPHGTGLASDGVTSAAVETVRFDSLALGALSAQGGEAIARDYGSRMPAPAALHGILARDFFADGLLILDYPNRTLSFSRELALPAHDPSLLGYDKAFRVPIAVGGIATQGNLDTGANVSLVMPRRLYDRLSGAPLAAAGQATLSNTQIDTGRALLEESVTIGAARIDKVEARVSDRYPELLVGAHILEKFTLMIDQRSRRIALCD